MPLSVSLAGHRQQAAGIRFHGHRILRFRKPDGPPDPGSNAVADRMMVVDYRIARMCGQ
jgi:hypothetical protein